MASPGAKGYRGKGPSASKPAQNLAGMYGVNLADVPHAGALISVEEVRKFIEEKQDNPLKPDDGSEPHDGPEPPYAPPEPAPAPTPPAPTLPAEPERMGEGDRVLIDGKAPGTITARTTGSDGKRLWLVISSQHAAGVLTVAYAPERLTRML